MDTGKEFLLEMCATPPTILEKYEKLEQLRALHIGGKICIVKTSYSSIGVDTPDDILKVEKKINESENYD